MQLFRNPLLLNYCVCVLWVCQSYPFSTNANQMLVLDWCLVLVLVWNCLNLQTLSESLYFFLFFLHTTVFLYAPFHFASHASATTQPLAILVLLAALTPSTTMVNYIASFSSYVLVNQVYTTLALVLLLFF